MMRNRLRGGSNAENKAFGAFLSRSPPENENNNKDDDQYAESLRNFEPPSHLPAPSRKTSTVALAMSFRHHVMIQVPETMSIQFRTPSIHILPHKPTDCIVTFQYRKSRFLASATTHANPSIKFFPVIALHLKICHRCVRIDSNCSAFFPPTHPSALYSSFLLPKLQLTV